MKMLIKLALINIICFASALSQTGKISVQISGFKTNKGLLRIVLFNQSQGFPSDYTYGLIIKSYPIDSTFISTTFDTLAYGDYAVSVLHDENQNEILDTNIFGMPKEGYGVSNNVNPRLRAPRFDEARFTLKEAQKNIEIILHYR
jgi:uncharacterized protein (DUF2141 family)